MLNLYEASFHSVEEESILDDARVFTTKYLKESLKNIEDQNFASFVSLSLDFPLHWILPRVETNWYIHAYEKRIDMHPTVLELAKLDFNMVQAIYQDDMKYASRWWKNTCWEKFGFARDRLVENFMWSVTENYLPHFEGRGVMTKVNAMITTIDDVYDVYGTLHELEQFTYAMNSWDVNAIEKLPEYYMRICFLACYNATNELSYNIMTKTGFFVNTYLKETDELERGDVPKSVQCYMHESGATEDEAKAYIKQLTLESWKKLNKERQTIDSEFSQEFIDCIMNLARMGHFMYTDGDKHGKPDMFKPDMFKPYDAKFNRIEDQLIVLIRRQVETELKLEEKFCEICEEVSNFVKESEDVVHKLERLSGNYVAKKTVRLLRRGQKRDLY
ncbi:terpene synthase 10-like protein isoform X2, partial [Tanacetum coccineum]